MDQVKIGKLITKLRKDKNMTQEELAEKLSVSNRSVSRWETGKNMPDMSLLIPISEILGITVTELLSGEIKEDVTLTAEQAVVDTINYSQKKISNISLKLKWMTIITVLVIFIISTVFIVQYIEEQSRISIFKSFTNETTKEEVIEKAGMPDNYSDINSSSKDSYFEYDISNNVKVTVYYALIDGNESVNSIKIKRKTKDEWIMSPLKGKYRLNIGGYNDYNYIIFDNGYYRIEGNNEELDILFEKREGKCSFVLNNMNSDSPDGIYFYLDDEKYIKGEDYPLINVRGNGYKSIIVRKNKEIRIKDEP